MFDSLEKECEIDALNKKILEQEVQITNLKKRICNQRRELQRLSNQERLFSKFQKQITYYMGRMVSESFRDVAVKRLGDDVSALVRDRNKA
jgi:hypothetical protein